MCVYIIIFVYVFNITWYVVPLECNEDLEMMILPTFVWFMATLTSGGRKQIWYGWEYVKPEQAGLPEWLVKKKRKKRPDRLTQTMSQSYILSK